MTAIDNMRLHARSVKLLTSYWHAVLVGETCGSYRLARPVRIASFAAVYKLQRQIAGSQTLQTMVDPPTHAILVRAACGANTAGSLCRIGGQHMSRTPGSSVARASTGSRICCLT